MKLKVHPGIAKPSHLFVLPPNATVMEAAEMMAEKKIGAVMVMQDKTLIGIFTERDLTVRVVVPCLDPSATKLEEVMTPNPDTIHKDENAMCALDMMNTRGYRHLPAVDDAGQVVTMVSVRDLYTLVQKELEFNIHQRESFIFGAGYGASA